MSLKSLSEVVSPARPAPRPVAEDEPALIVACREGDRRALEALYHRYKRRVFGVVARICGRIDAEEVSQEAFVRIFRGIAKFRGDSALSTWIYRLAVNAALTHVERRPRPAAGEEVLAELPAPPTTERDPRLAARLESAIALLSPGYRAVLVLHDVEGLSHEEIGNILGCRIGTSKSQLFKARARMRDLLGLDQGAFGLASPLVPTPVEDADQGASGPSLGEASRASP